MKRNLALRHLNPQGFHGRLCSDLRYLSVAKRNTNICLALIGVAEDDAMEVFENDYYW